MDLPSLEYPAIAELATLRQWVCWRLVPRKPKPTKVPYCPATGEFASTVDPKTWGTFQEACSAFVQSGDYAGIGFVFTEGDPYVGVDLDNAIADDGTVSAEAQEICRSFATYTEISPSGRGLHLVGRTKLGAFKGIKKGKIEVYSAGRYFTITGQVPEGAPEAITECDHALGALLHTLRGGQDALRAAPTAPAAQDVSHETSMEQLTALVAPFLAADAQPPFDKFEALCANSPAVRQTFDHERRDVKTESWTASEWDLALASYFVAAGWEVGEIVAALIAHRRQHGYDLKLRADYYARTIYKARQGQLRDEAQDVLAAVDGEEIPKEQILAALSTIYGIKFQRVVRFDSEPAAYRIETEKGSITGDVDMIVNQTAFRRSMAEATGIIVREVKKPLWEDRAQRLLHSAEPEAVGLEAKSGGEARALVEKYLQGSPRVSGSDKEGAIKNGHPFLDGDGHICIVGAAFNDWLRTALNMRLEARKVGLMLRAMGAESRAEHCLVDGRRSTRSVWRLPK